MSRASPARKALRTPRQPVLPGFEFMQKLSQQARDGFGGSRLASNPKTARPFDSKRCTHLVLRSERARGERSLLLFGKEIAGILATQSRIHGVKLRNQANAGNHLHLIVQTRTRRSMQNFLRAISGLIARKVLGAEKGRPANGAAVEQITSTNTNEEFKFWDSRPFSRLVNWGNDYSGLNQYLMLNRIEMTGMDRLSTRQMLAKIAALTRANQLVPLGFS